MNKLLAILGLGVLSLRGCDKDWNPPKVTLDMIKSNQDYVTPDSSVPFRVYGFDSDRDGKEDLWCAYLFLPNGQGGGELELYEYTKDSNGNGMLDYQDLDNTKINPKYE